MCAALRAKKEPGKGEDAVAGPNTSGARTAAEAIRIARIAREAGCGNWVKIEIIIKAKMMYLDFFPK